ncbi:MAG TPA: SUMF1/EgtB/PvdO family nonheme iron enzyme [bacterium]
MKEWIRSICFFSMWPLLMICLIALYCGKGGPENQNKPKPANQGSLKGLIPLGKNTQGHVEFRHEKSGIILIKISSDSFIMGSDKGDADEKPMHNVLVNGFFIGKYEVSNEQYKIFCDSTGHSYPKSPNFKGMDDYFLKYPDYPVANVTWEDARSFCDWAQLRLPTEAEWEMAARGNDRRKYPWGNDEPNAGGTYRCNLFGSSPFEAKLDGYQYTSPVNVFDSGISPFGCYAMAGNVWEWCADWYLADYYAWKQNADPQGPENGTDRVMRGGSWTNDGDGVRTANRDSSWPVEHMGSFGFRPAL